MNNIYNVTIRIERVAGPSGKAEFGSRLVEVELEPSMSEGRIIGVIKTALDRIDRSEY